VSDDDDDTQTLPSDASINLVKAGTLNLGANGRADAGDTISYTFTVTNTGNVTLTNVTVADTVGGVTVSGGPIASLAPGAVDNTTFTGSYTLTQADVNSGSFTNTATATGTPPVGDDVSDPDDDTQSLPAVPSIELVKTGTLNMGANGRADAGDTITYVFTVTNTGNVTLTNVTVTDTVGGVTISGGPIASLAPGATNSTTFTGSYTLSQADVNSGSFTNTATATGTPPVGDDVNDPDDDTQTLPAVPSINLVKTGTLNMGANGRADAGDTITYTFTVTNTGNVTLSNVTVTDTVGGVTISGGPIASLAPGAVDNTTFTGSYTLTQADVNSGSFTNTATATGTPPSGPAVSDSDDDSQILTPVPSVDLQKTGTLNDGGNGRADAGDTITYTFTVTNTGNVTLTNVTVSEDFGGITLTGSPIPSLAPGAVDSTTYTGSYILTQADVDAGSFTNRAIVTGAPPFGANVTDDDDDVQTLAADPSIELIKTGLVDSTVVLPVGVVDPGDVINYTFTVTNTGNVTLSNVTVTDTVGGVTISGGPIASLAPGVSNNTTFTGSYTLTQPDVDAGSFTNTATATGTSPVGDAVSDDGDDTRNLGDEPAIGIAKRLVSAPVEVSPGTWDVTFAYLVRNYGNVTLTSVQVADDLAAAFPGAVSVVLQSIESNDFSVSSTYDGVTDTAMLDGSDSLAFQEQGAITVVVRVIPVDGGPYNNTAIASGQPPTGDPVDDNSQDGTDPDPDDDRDPTNNDDPTPVDFGPNMFDPPFGQKTFDDRGFPLLRWTMVWVNNSNIVNLLASVSDPIPVGSTYETAGLASGTGVPLTAPSLSTDVGVSCTAGPGLLTTTTWCYYEGPTPEYIRGRIVWEGSLGPDLGVTNPALAQNALTIVFNMRVNDGVQEINNLATIGVDRDGDGVISGANEEVVASASEIWSDWPGLLPRTGFAPGRASDMSMEPAVAYQDLGGLILEIPSLGVYAPILGVPIKHGLWNLDWLGDNVGYLENTAFPTWKGNSALTAHNYNVRGEPGLFADLGTLRWGAEIIVHGWGRKYVYEVRSVQNWVKPDDTSVITHEEYPWLTLITCRSYDEKSDSYRWRTAVRAVQVRIE
jgi:LPXTG-site transpeptidase (sortase) family protein